MTSFGRSAGSHKQSLVQRGLLREPLRLTSWDVRPRTPADDHHDHATPPCPVLVSAEALVLTLAAQLRSKLLSA